MGHIIHASSFKITFSASFFKIIDTNYSNFPLELKEALCINKTNHVLNVEIYHYSYKAPLSYLQLMTRNCNQIMFPWRFVYIRLTWVLFVNRRQSVIKILTIIVAYVQFSSICVDGCFYAMNCCMQYEKFVFVKIALKMHFVNTIARLPTVQQEINYKTPNYKVHFFVFTFYD